MPSKTSIKTDFFYLIISRNTCCDIIFLFNYSKTAFGICFHLTSVANNCGFQDVNYFYKVFNKYVGMTTKEYKDKIKGKSDDV